MLRHARASASSWFSLLRFHVFALSALVLLLVFGKIAPFGARLRELAIHPWSRDAHDGMVQGYRLNADPKILESAMRTFDPAVAFLDLTDTVPFVAFRGLSYEPFFPAYPARQFLVLPHERQVVYLERFFTRHRPTAGQLLRFATQKPYSEDALEQVLERYYRRTSRRAGHLPDVVIDTYSAK
jgi:hypothetical protein